MEHSVRPLNYSVEKKHRLNHHTGLLHCSGEKLQSPKKRPQDQWQKQLLLPSVFSYTVWRLPESGLQWKQEQRQNSESQDKQAHVSLLTGKKIFISLCEILVSHRAAMASHRAAREKKHRSTNRAYII